MKGAIETAKCLIPEGSLSNFSIVSFSAQTFVLRWLYLNPVTELILQCDVTKRDHFPNRLKLIFLKLQAHETWVEMSFDGLTFFNCKQQHAHFYSQDRKDKLFGIPNSFLLKIFSLCLLILTCLLEMYILSCPNTEVSLE